MSTGSSTNDALANIVESIRYTRRTYGISDAAKEYQRRYTVTYTDPTPEQWKDYWEAVKHLEALYKYDGFYGGHDGPELEEPRPTRHVEYTETVDEWKARAAVLLAEAGGVPPKDIANALDDEILKALGIVAPSPRTFGWSRNNDYAQGGPLMKTIPEAFRNNGRHDHAHVGFEDSPEA